MTHRPGRYRTTQKLQPFIYTFIFNIIILKLFHNIKKQHLVANMPSYILQLTMYIYIVSYVAIIQLAINLVILTQDQQSCRVLLMKELCSTLCSSCSMQLYTLACLQLAAWLYDLSKAWQKTPSVYVKLKLLVNNSAVTIAKFQASFCG